jgi:hypothetical protein
MTAAAGAPIWMEALVRSAIALPFCPCVPDVRIGAAPDEGRRPVALPRLCSVQGTAPRCR